MRFTCANCMEVFERNEECMMHFRDDAIYLFCKRLQGQMGLLYRPSKGVSPGRTGGCLAVQQCRFWSLIKNVHNVRVSNGTE